MKGSFLTLNLKPANGPVKCCQWYDILACAFRTGSKRWELWYPENSSFEEKRPGKRN